MRRHNKLRRVGIQDDMLVKIADIVFDIASDQLVECLCWITHLRAEAFGLNVKRKGGKQ